MTIQITFNGGPSYDMDAATIEEKLVAFGMGSTIKKLMNARIPAIGGTFDFNGIVAGWKVVS